MRRFQPPLSVVCLISALTIAIGILSATTASAAGGVSDPLLLAPLSIDFDFDQQVAANTTLTDAFSYTVPAGREFRLEQARVGAQGGVGNTSMRFGSAASILARIVPTGGVTTPQFYATESFQGAAYFPSGTVLSAAYYDASTTDASWMVASMHGTEFSAP